MLQVEDDVQGMRRHDPVDEHAGKIEEVLDRVHCKARPWTGIGVLVVEMVHRAVERRPMDKAVDQIEMRLAKDRDQEEDGDAVDGVSAEVDIGDVAVRHRPER